MNLTPEERALVTVAKTKMLEAADMIDMLRAENDGLRQKLAAAERDTQRLDWLLPIVSGDDNNEADARALKVAASLLAGLDGRAAIDAAMTSHAEAQT